MDGVLVQITGGRLKIYIDGVTYQTRYPTLLFPDGF